MELDEKQRLTRLEALTETVLKKQDVILDSLDKYSKDFSIHLQQTAVFNDRLHRVESGISKHSEELYGTGQLVYTVKRLAEKDETLTKAIWEIAKPVFGILGIGLAVLIGMFAVIFYSLQQIVQAILRAVP